jgi:hypothetical protein
MKAITQREGPRFHRAIRKKTLSRSAKGYRFVTAAERREGCFSRNGRDIELQALLDSAHICAAFELRPLAAFCRAYDSAGIMLLVVDIVSKSLYYLSFMGQHSQGCLHTL